MSETNQHTPMLESLTFTEESIRDALAEMVVQREAYNPADPNSSVPHFRREVGTYFTQAEEVSEELLLSYVEHLKFEEVAMANYGKREPNYWSKLEQIVEMSETNVRKLYIADSNTNPLLSMLAYQVAAPELSAVFVKPALKLVKKVYGTVTTPELMHSHPNDLTLHALTVALQNGDRKIMDFYDADTKRTDRSFEDLLAGKPANLDAGSQILRKWMREAVSLASGITDLEQTDAYVYAMSRDIMGMYSLNNLVEFIRTYGPDKLAAIKEFANISALASYSKQQLDRMYRLSQGDEAEVERLSNHDVIVMLVDKDGDHNGVSRDVSERMDDDAERTLFFEINNPHQVYQHLKKLHELGISPSTLIFASHGSPGQFFISERPALDADQVTEHITLVIDQDLADYQVAQSGEVNIKGYDIAKANGLIRSIQRFVQPSRGIDDPEKDLGRKKIISLSCGFDGEAHRGYLSDTDEVVEGADTTLLRRLGEVIVARLNDEHIDIYGATISTNQQTRTDKGFYFNQIRYKQRAPYPASVLHVDGQTTKWHRLNEVELRK